MKQWCADHSIEGGVLSKYTFSHYVCLDEGKRLKLVEGGGKALGKPTLLSVQNSGLLVDVIRQSDRGNQLTSLPQVTHATDLTTLRLC